MKYLKFLFYIFFFPIALLISLGFFLTLHSIIKIGIDDTNIDQILSYIIFLVCYFFAIFIKKIIKKAT